MTVARGPKRVLVVEDEENISQTLRYNLTREGYEVSEAATGTAAIELARQRHPDLILLDLMLPEMSGLDVCRVLRAEMSTPILMLTAKAGEIDTVVGLQVGADDYVTKPFSLNELMARVAAMLRRAELAGGQQVRPGEVEEFSVASASIEPPGRCAWARTTCISRPRSSTCSPSCLPTRVGFSRV